MKLVTEVNKEITLKEVLKDGNNYLIVAVFQNNPLKVEFRGNDKYTFSIVGGEEFSLKIGNGYSFKAGFRYSLKEILEDALKNPKVNIQVFHKNNWKEAYKWLIENVE